MSLVLSKQFAQKIFNQLKKFVGRFVTELGGDLERSGSRMTDDVAYKQVFSRHRNITSINDVKPEIKDSFIASNATVAGEVQIDSYSYIGYNVVMRGDSSPIR